LVANKFFENVAKFKCLGEKERTKIVLTKKLKAVKFGELLLRF